MDFTIDTWERAQTKYSYTDFSADNPDREITDQLKRVRKFWEQYYVALDEYTEKYSQDSLRHISMLEPTYAAYMHRPDVHSDLGRFLMASIHPEDRALLAICLIDDVRQAMNTSFELAKFCTEELSLECLSRDELAQDRWDYVVNWQKQGHDIVAALGAVVAFQRVNAGGIVQSPSQSSFLLGLAEHDPYVCASRVSPRLSPTRAFPESVTIQGDGSALAVVWLLKNPGYGETLVKVLNGIPTTQQYKTWLAEDAISTLHDQWIIRESSISEDAKEMPWDLFIPAGAKKSYKGWYRSNAKTLIDLQGKGYDLERKFQGTASLGRIEYYPYRTSDQRTIPDLLKVLNEQQRIFLPSQMHAIKTLTALIRQGDIRFAVRDYDLWQQLVADLAPELLNVFTRLASKLTKDAKLSKKALQR